MSCKKEAYEGEWAGPSERNHLFSHLDNNHCFLHDVADPGLDQVHQHVYASLSRRINLDGCLSNGLDGSSYKVHIHL
jgi:hypothetical protein